MMPGMNGFEVLDILKSDRRFVRIPVIMQSGTSEEKDIDDGFSKGIVSFLHKPYKMNDLIKKVKAALP